MIHTAQQLKGLVRNLSKGDNVKAQTLMRSYATERFLERLSLSPYRESLVLKGGVLVAAMVGLNSRSTMDIDTTIKNLALGEEDARQIVEAIVAVPLEDNMAFTIKSVETIMDEDDYPGIRILMEATLERIHIPMKIDFSIGDAITPREIIFPMKLLFEDRSISVLSYNIETLLAEKMETVVSRGTANTRMRDFYDMYLLAGTQADSIDYETLYEAFANTCEQRETKYDKSTIDLVLGEIEFEPVMKTLWQKYQRKYAYAAGVDWLDVLFAVKELFRKSILI